MGRLNTILTEMMEPKQTDVALFLKCCSFFSVCFLSKNLQSKEQLDVYRLKNYLENKNKTRKTSGKVLIFLSWRLLKIKQQ